MFSPAASVEQFGGCRRGGGVTVVLSVVVVGRDRTHVVVRLEANTAGRISTVNTPAIGTAAIVVLHQIVNTFAIRRESVYHTH